MYDESVSVIVGGVKVLREVDDTLVCSIKGIVRFIPLPHVRGAVPKPSEVGFVAIPQWLAESLALV